MEEYYEHHQEWHEKDIEKLQDYLKLKNISKAIDEHKAKDNANKLCCLGLCNGSIQSIDYKCEDGYFS